MACAVHQMKSLYIEDVGIRNKGEKNPAANELGRLGGKAKSETKTKAARENAKKGGWPKGKPRKP